MGDVVSGFKAVTSTAGTFEIGSLGAASYRLSVLDTGRLMKTNEDRQGRASGWPARDRRRGRRREAVRHDPGTVTGPDGAPIAEAWVAVHQSLRDQWQNACDDPSDCRITGSVGTGSHQPPPAMTDARGHFELTSLRPGRYQVVAEGQAGKLRGGAADVTTDARDLDPALERGLTTRHRARVAWTHRPVLRRAFRTVGRRSAPSPTEPSYSLGSIRATTRSRSHRPTERARRRCESRRTKSRPSTSCWWRMGRLRAASWTRPASRSPAWASRSFPINHPASSALSCTSLLRAAVRTDAFRSKVRQVRGRSSFSAANRRRNEDSRLQPAARSMSVT